MPTQNEIRERVTNEIVDALQNGVMPWRKPWTAAENTGYPANIVSKRLYSGINPLLLQFSAYLRGFVSKWWATYNQWQSLGFQVRRRPTDVSAGQWGTRIVFFKPVKTVKKNAQGEEKESSFPLLREYTVFSADQVDGPNIDKFRVQAPSNTNVIDYQPAEQVIAATGADIRHVVTDRACYVRPPHDFIQMPLKSQFEQSAAYYSTAMHELSHWSESRLGWAGSYGMGELRAELAAAYLLAAVGVPQVDFKENASYLGEWIATLKEDHRAIFRISSAASKAAHFILAFSQQQQAEEEREEAVCVA